MPPIPAADSLAVDDPAPVPHATENAPVALIATSKFASLDSQVMLGGEANGVPHSPSPVSRHLR
jgi:hypothetical protein